MKRFIRPIRSSISSAGRFQFSDEKLKIVRYVMPSSIAARTVRRTASTPCRWPSERGMPALLRPAAVAVHDDGDVPRRRQASVPVIGRLRAAATVEWPL